MTNQVRYNTVNSSGVRVADRAVSADLWRNLRDKFILGGDDAQLGVAEFYDFVHLSPNTTDASTLEGWKLQDAAAGGTNESFVSAADPDGIGVVSATTGTDWFGISIARINKNINLASHGTNPRGDSAFGYRLSLDAVDTYFVGLGEETEEFLSTTGTLPTDTDYIGFYRLDGGNLLFVAANDNNGGTAVLYSVIVMLAADIPDASAEFTKLEWRVNKDLTVEISVGGTIRKLDTSGNPILVNPLALPIETLTTIVETQRGATGDLATVDIPIDWYARVSEA